MSKEMSKFTIINDNWLRINHLNPLHINTRNLLDFSYGEDSYSKSYYIRLTHAYGPSEIRYQPFEKEQFLKDKELLEEFLLNL